MWPKFLALILCYFNNKKVFNVFYSMTQILDLQQLLQQSKTLKSRRNTIATIYTISKKLSAHAPPATKKLDHLNLFENSFHKRKLTKLDKAQELEQKAIIQALESTTKRYQKYMAEQLDKVYQKIAQDIKENALSLQSKQPTLELKIQNDNKYKGISLKDWHTVGNQRLWNLVMFIYKETSVDDIIKRSKEFLEKEFVNVIQKICERQPAISKLTINCSKVELVEAFLRVKYPQQTKSQRLYFLLRTGEPVDLSSIPIEEDPFCYALRKCRGDLLSAKEQNELDKHVHHTWEHYFWHVLFLYCNKQRPLQQIEEELKLQKGNAHDKALKCFSIGEYGLALYHLLQDPQYALDGIHLALFLNYHSKLKLPSSIVLNHTLYDSSTKCFHLHNLIVSFLPKVPSAKDKLNYLFFLNNETLLPFMHAQIIELLVNGNKQTIVDIASTPGIEEITKLSQDQIKKQIVASAASRAFKANKIELSLYLWDYMEDIETVLFHLNDALSQIIQGIPLYTFQKSELVSLSEKYVKNKKNSSATARLLDILKFKDFLIEQNYEEALKVILYSYSTCKTIESLNADKISFIWTRN